MDWPAYSAGSTFFEVSFRTRHIDFITAGLRTLLILLEALDVAFAADWSTNIPGDSWVGVSINPELNVAADCRHTLAPTSSDTDAAEELKLVDTFQKVSFCSVDINKRDLGRTLSRI